MHSIVKPTVSNNLYRGVFDEQRGRIDSGYSRPAGKMTNVFLHPNNSSCV